MNHTIYIYALVDPTKNDEIFYVGRTSLTLAQRLASHVRDGRKLRTAKGKRIADILLQGCKPQIACLTALHDATAPESWEAEQAWINFLSITCKLTNTNSAKSGGHTNRRKINWSPDLLARLGKEPDYKIAREIGCHRKAVEYQRVKFGIPRCPQTNFVTPNIAGWNRKELPESIHVLLGTMSDYKLAKIAGVSENVIKRVRKQKGIDNYVSAKKVDTNSKKDTAPQMEQNLNAGVFAEHREDAK